MERPTEFEFADPYELLNTGDGVYRLVAHGVPVASYSVKSWGSSAECIRAAWKRAYGSNLPDAGEIETIMSLVPDRIEPVEGKPLSQQIVDAAWPIAGGNHQDAEFWWAVSFAALVAERIVSGDGRTQ